MLSLARLSLPVHLEAEVGLGAPQTHGQKGREEGCCTVQKLWNKLYLVLTLQGSGLTHPQKCILFSSKGLRLRYWQISCRQIAP